MKYKTQEEIKIFLHSLPTRSISDGSMIEFANVVEQLLDMILDLQKKNKSSMCQSPCQLCQARHKSNHEVKK